MAPASVRRWCSAGVTPGSEVRHGAYLSAASFGKQRRCLFRKAASLPLSESSTAASFEKQYRCVITARVRAQAPKVLRCDTVSRSPEAVCRARVSGTD